MNTSNEPELHRPTCYLAYTQSGLIQKWVSDFVGVGDQWRLVPNHCPESLPVRPTTPAPLPAHGGESQFKQDEEANTKAAYEAYPMNYGNQSSREDLWCGFKHGFRAGLAHRDAQNRPLIEKMVPIYPASSDMERSINFALARLRARAGLPPLNL